MADPFQTMVYNLQSMGFFQFLFPFLLAFAILYGSLQWIFKEGLGGQRVHALISVVLAFFVMLYSAYNTWLYTMLAEASGIWLGMATVLLFIVVITALAGVNLHEVLGGAPKGLKYLAVLVIIYIVIVSILGTGAYSTYLPFWLTGSDLWTVVLVIIILAIVFWFVGGEGKKEEGEKAPAAKPG
jgi:hypothetical protein